MISLVQYNLKSSPEATKSQNGAFLIGLVTEKNIMQIEYIHPFSAERTGEPVLTH